MVKGNGILKDFNTKYEKIVKLIRDAIKDDLTVLDLSCDDIDVLPTEIKEAQQIRYLNVSGNNLKSLPESIGKLKNLKELVANDNQLTELPKSLEKLKNLKALYLSSNFIRKFPPIISSIPSLSEIDLSHNEITDIPETLSITELTYLDIEENKIYHFPKEILKRNFIYGLNLSGNPINNIPQEIFNYTNDCAKGVKNYFDSIEKEQVTHLYEVKLLIVGRGQVGKTCLSRKLMNPNYEVTHAEDSTEGIHINKWNLACSYKETHKDITINIWDFGGQEIYHATHQFFLTKRSVYLFVWDARQEEDYVSFDYWLNIIALLSNNSPVIIVQNKVDDRVKEIQQSLYKEKYPNIIGFHKTSCISGRGIVPLIDELKSTISKLQHLGDELPNSWLSIRDFLEKDNRNYIEYTEYIEICHRYGLDEKKAGFLSDYFHDLGIILHFRDDEILQDIIILKTEWGTDAVYKVLDNESITEEKGRFTFRDVRNIWSENKFQGKHLQLLQLMKKFELCFQLNNTMHYIAPALLPTEEPKLTYLEKREYKEYYWVDNDNVIFEYHYTFMPAGIFTRFMVKMHGYIEHDFYWRNGVYLNFEGTAAKVVNNPLNRKISIRLRGSSPKNLLAIIRFHISEIHKTLNNPEVKEMIPCNCSECETKPKLYEYSILLNASKKGIPEIQCHKSFNLVSVDKLLEGIPRKIDPEKLGIKKYEVNIFEGFSEVEELKKGQNELKKGQENITNNLDSLKSALVEDLLSSINESDRRLVKEIQQQIEKQIIPKEKILTFIKLVQESLLDITKKFGENDSMIEKANKLSEVINSDPDLKGKFKLSIPIIPTVLKYEKELSWDLKALFAEIKNDFGEGNIFTKNIEENSHSSTEYRISENPTTSS